MYDYEELVKWLRNCSSDSVDDCAGCPHIGGHNGNLCINCLIVDAADAIEELWQCAHYYKDLADNRQMTIQKILEAEAKRMSQPESQKEET